MDVVTESSFDWVLEANIRRLGDCDAMLNAVDDPMLSGDTPVIRTGKSVSTSLGTPVYNLAFSAFYSICKCFRSLIATCLLIPFGMRQCCSHLVSFWCRPRKISASVSLPQAETVSCAASTRS